MENTTKSVCDLKKIKRPRDLISSYKKKHREERKERRQEILQDHGSYCTRDVDGKMHIYFQDRGKQSGSF